jgi:ERCC4-related helicase
MVKKRVLSPLPILDEGSFLEVLETEGIKDVHARPVWNYAINKVLQGSKGDNTGVTFTEDVPNVPKRLNAVLRERFVLCSSRVVQERHSTDGTIKLLIELQDGQRVEAVIIPHKGDTAKARNTLCVSSQIGCQMACTFCATGMLDNIVCSDVIVTLAFIHMSRCIRHEVVLVAAGSVYAFKE